MRAWRVVQASTFEKLYRPRPLWDSVRSSFAAVFGKAYVPPKNTFSKNNTSRTKKSSNSKPSFINRFLSKIFSTRPLEEYWGPVKPTDFAEGMTYKWYSADLLIVESFESKNKNGQSKEIIGFHAGTYLRTMFGVLTIILILSLLPLYVSSIQIAIGYSGEIGKVSGKFACHGYFVILIAAFLIINIVMTIVVVSRIVRSQSRRKIIESGLLSIHSCSIMWHVVVVAHYRALHDIQSPNGSRSLSYRGYTERLSYQTASFLEHIEDVHQWVQKPPSSKPEPTKPPASERKTRQA